MGSLGQGIRLTSASQSAAGQAQSAEAIASATLVPLPDDTPMYACQVCGQHFPTLHQVKTHEGRFHKQFAPQRDLTNKASYSLDGLPTCRFCRQAFVRWTSLQRHIRLNRCPGLRVTSSTGQTCDRETHSDASAPLTRPGPDTESKAAVWTLDRPLAQSALHPVLHWSSVLELAPPRRWEDIVKLPGVVDYLRRHCGLCGQWIAKTNGVRKHLRESHRSERERHAERIEHWTRSWSKVITRPCPVCSANVVDIRQHGGSCVVMQQAALVQLCLSGCKADERPLQSDAGSWGGCDGGRGDGARASEKAQAGGARAEAEAKGQRERQGQRPGQKGRGAGSSDSSDLRLVVKQLGQLVLRQAEALNRLEYDTCFLLVLQTSPHPGTVIPSLFKVASAWKEKREHSPSDLTQSLKQVTLACLVKELTARADMTVNTPQNQEAGRGHGPVGWGSLGLSDLGPQAATECPGHIAEAGSCGGLSSSDINHAAVHPGGGTHKVSSTEAPDGGALGHASPIPPRCLPEGASDARAAPYMGSAGRVRSHWGQAAPIAHSQGAATGEGLRAPPQPLIAGSPDWLSGVILGNAGNFCYSNAVFLALAMMLPVGPPITAVGKLLGRIWRAPASMLFLHKQGEWRQLTNAWPNPQLQHDAAEFLQHLAQHDELVQDLSVWHTIAVEGEGLRGWTLAVESFSFRSEMTQMPLTPYCRTVFKPGMRSCNFMYSGRALSSWFCS